MVRDVKEQSGRRKGWVRYNPDHGGGVGGHQIDGIGCGDIGGDGGGIFHGDFQVEGERVGSGTTLDDGAGGDHHGGGDHHQIGVGVGGVDGGGDGGVFYGDEHCLLKICFKMEEIHFPILIPSMSFPEHHTVQKQHVY